MRGLHGIPVGQGDQPAAPDGHCTGGLFEGRIGASLEHRIAELLPEPASQVGARVLHDFKHVLTRDARCVGAEDVGVFIAGAVYPGNQCGAHVQVGLVRPDRSDTQSGGLTVAAGRHQRDRLIEPPPLADLTLHDVDDRGRRHQFGQLGTIETGVAEHQVRPGQVGHVEQSEAVGGGLGVDPASGHGMHQIGVHPDQLVGPTQHLGFVVGEPSDLVDRRRDIGLEAGQLVHSLGTEATHLVGCPAIKPNDAGTQRFAVLVDQRERLALNGRADVRDACLVIDGQRGHGPGNGRIGAEPPVAGVLLIEVDPGRVQLELGLALGKHRAGLVNDDRLGARSRTVNADYQRGNGHEIPPRAGWLAA